ncbi:winged helix-turn-helix domain-containing protein [Enterococcus crotali]|uniref:winged helix-turn-helix domain-containing protein n=1 Tax=Enterococcus crotali TaxID=1453587 RepID=UPI00046ED4CB|nr:winged helix-turn-helix domain-containing protein [Enterococcus crotali]
MFELGYLIVKESGESRHLNFLSEKGWHLSDININEQIKDHKKIDAIIIFEETMPITCYWLMELKKYTDAPIFLLSKENESHSNIVYLQLGIKACFPIAMDPEELYFTLTNLLSYEFDQNNSLLANPDEVAQEETLELIPRNLSVSIPGKDEISLTKREYQVLELLYDSPGKTISYEEFSEKLFISRQDGNKKNYRVANLIFNLRNKIETSTTNPTFIKTVRSKGYMLNLK